MHRPFRATVRAFVSLLAAVLFLAPQISGGASAASGTLKITGTVQLPDGSPAADAIILIMGEANLGLPEVTVRTDAQGRFELTSWAGDDCRIHARTSDSTFQTTLSVPSALARTKFARPLELRLTPAERHVVTVLAEGKPVADAHVVAVGTPWFKISGRTDASGQAELLLPSTERLNELVAWHPTLGAAGLRRLESRPKQASTELSLLRPVPLTIRVVDTSDKPLVDVPISAHVSTKTSDWIVTGNVDAAHMRTDAQGEAVLAWAPADGLQYVEVNMLDPTLKVDETDRDGIPQRIVTAHVRRKLPVEGRLILPEGTNAEGIFITGFGFGLGNNGDIPVVRARRDGSFTMSVAPDHGYALGVSDNEWASDLWTGMIIAGETAKPADLTLSVYRAAPLTVRIVRGPNREPVADAWINFETTRDFEWHDAKGKKHNAESGVRGWLRTNADGIAETGVGKGEHKIRIGAGNWSEEKTIKVASDAPVTVEFNREWMADRKLVGRLTHDGQPFKPSPGTVVKVWSNDQLSQSDLLKPQIKADGTFDFVLDAKELSVYVTDNENKLSGFKRLQPVGASVDLELAPMASYSGQIVDAGGLVPGRAKLRMAIKDSWTQQGFMWVAEDQFTDDGSFRYDALPAGVPLNLWASDPATKNEVNLVNVEKQFLPGEVRAGERLMIRSAGGSGAKRPSLAEMLDRTVRDARLCGMRTFVILQGDASRNAAKISQDVTDNALDDVLPFRTIIVPATVDDADAATLAEKGWPRPAAELLTLIVLDGQGNAIDTTRVPTSDADIGYELARAFIKRNAPPKRDARAMLAAARSEAEQSGRRVWVVIGGPRCGPCFMLARWMDDQHQLLDKDYVIVKILSGLDTRSQEVEQELRASRGGIPWYTIMGPDGMLLATSDGPLGNIAFPTELEDRRYLREMFDRTANRLTAEERDRLIQSLEPPK